jgi:hypothetical protein
MSRRSQRRAERKANNPYNRLVKFNSSRNAHRLEKMKLRNERKKIAQEGKVAKWQSKADASKYKSEADIVAYQHGITPTSGKGLEFAKGVIDTAVTAFGKPAGQTFEDLPIEKNPFGDDISQPGNNKIILIIGAILAFFMFKKSKK